MPLGSWQQQVATPRKGHGDHASARLRGAGAPAHHDDAPGRVSLIVPIVGADGGGGAR